MNESNTALQVVKQGFPVMDWSALHKDMTITAEDCAKAMGVSPEVLEVQGYLLVKLRDAIRERRPDLEAHVHQHRGGLVILTDAGADDRTWRNGLRAIGSLSRTHSIRASIDTSQLTDEERRRSDAHDAALGRAALAAARAVTNHKLTPGEAGLLKEAPEDEDD